MPTTTGAAKDFASRRHMQRLGADLTVQPIGAFIGHTIRSPMAGARKNAPSALQMALVTMIIDLA
jgi:hypothetical protein